MLSSPFTIPSVSAGVATASSHNNGASTSAGGGGIPVSTNAAALVHNPPQSLGAVLANISVIQRQTRTLEKDIALVTDEVSFSKEELERGKGVLLSGFQELEKVRQLVSSLSMWQVEHSCVAADSDYSAYQESVKQLRARTFQVEEKEEHVQGVLLATRDLMAQVEELRRRAADPDDYIKALQERIEQHELTIGEAQSVSDERSRLDREFTANEAEIRALRGKLESAGVDVPEAPQTHRIRRLVARSTRALGSNSVTSPGKSGAASPAGKSAVAAADSSSLPPAASSPGPYRHRGGPAGATLSDVIRIPVGALRPLSHQLGKSLRELAQECGVSFAVEIQESQSVLHVEGAVSPGMEVFRKRVMDAVQRIDAEMRSGGMVTYSTRSLNDARQETANKIGDLMRPHVVGEANVNGEDENGDMP